MGKKVVFTISLLVVFLAGLSLFGYYVQKNAQDRASNGDSFFDSFILFPDRAMEVLSSNEIKNLPPTFEMKHFFDPVNLLSKDFYGINGFYLNDEESWEIRLFNFKNDSVLHRWRMDKQSFKTTDRLYRNSEPRNPILLPNRNIIVANDESRNLYRLDSESNVLWHNTELRFHHAMNLAADGNVWMCSTEPRVIKSSWREPVYYDDNFITKVDINSGNVVYHKSCSEILIENGLRSFVYGFSHVINGASDVDPLHLNDIEPVLTDGPYWKKGDVFLSFRHRSLVFLYRPSTNKIIRLIFGPFLRQHDVDILNDSTISIFNNEGTNVGKEIKEGSTMQNLPVKDVTEQSNIIHYHFSDSSYSYDLQDHFKQNNIFTETQGFHQYLSDGSVYVEQHGRGIMYFLKGDSVLFRNQGTNWIGGWVERPHWIRIYEEIDF